MTDAAVWGPRTTAEASARPKIVKANALGAWGVCGAIYGPPGVGKTTFVCDAADSEYGAPVLMLDVEGGARTIAHRGDIDVAPITNDAGKGFEHLKAYRDDLVAARIKYGTVLVDNISEIIAMAVVHTLRTVPRKIAASDRPDQNDWSKINTDMLLLVRSFRDFARLSGTNVFFIAWEAPEKDEATGRVKRDLAMNPSFARQFPGIVDMVGHLTVRSTGVRQLSFEASDKTAAKFRRSGDENANQIPDVLRYRREDKPLVDILAVLKGHKSWPADKYKRSASANAE